MRLLLEVLSCSLETAKFPNRRTGQIDETQVRVICGVDQDFFDSLIKVKVYKPKKLNQSFKKGDLIQVRFRQAKYSDFEKSIVINANEDDVQLHQNGSVKQAEPIAQAA